MAGRRRLSFTPETPLLVRTDGIKQERQSPSPSPKVEFEKEVVSALSGLAHLIQEQTAQFEQFSAEVRQQLTDLNSRITSLHERTHCGCAKEPKKRRVHNPKIAEAVRRLHNSEGNNRRYEPEEGLSSPHNEAVTSHLMAALTASPGLSGVESGVLLAACKTYYETVRRNYRYSQPDLAGQAEAMKVSARNRQRRKRLLEARRGELANKEEMDMWKGVTIDLMSDEEDGTADGMSGWIVRPPSFRSVELSNLCEVLQQRLEENPKYVATHHKRLCTGPPSDRVAPSHYDPDARKKHFLKP
ncbi:uncharacterized protein C14orf93 homolog [Sphaeramia orbicularis]|uniref:uncharacterized protein C14orf93 homolog n=1 Tax=Sphaeramia orbicularis TaxID=375764 RepID=UPI00117D67FA|nr:uncharacterized protein C14orf93 homolog [Sphaeramia orbicularis]